MICTHLSLIDVNTLFILGGSAGWRGPSSARAASEAVACREGSESYARLARTLAGGLAVSVALTVFLVPAGFYWVYGKQERAGMREAS